MYPWTRTSRFVRCCVGNENISISINSNSGGRIQLRLASSLSAFRHVSCSFEQGTEPGKLGLWHLNRSLREYAYGLLKLLNVLVRDVQHVKGSYSSGKREKQRSPLSQDPAAARTF